MKRTAALLILLLMTSLTYGQSNAAEYLSLIGEQYQKISHEMMGYIAAANHGKSARKVEKRRNELLTQMKESETVVRRMKPFKGSTALRDSISSFFKISRLIMLEDYGKIVNLEDVAEQSYDMMEAYLLAKELAETKADSAEASAHRQYQAFADENNIKLIESTSDLKNKVEKTAKVSTYTNKAYLLFFKSYKNEAYLMEAMEKNDITAFEQSKNALSSSATEDLKKSGELPPFNADGSLKQALKQALKFYQYETEKLQAFSQYLIAKDNFEKIKKSYDATPQSKRTKEVVDNYNKSVNEINRSGQALNTMNQDLNKKRSAMIKTWNDTYDGFIDKHTPKYSR